MTEFNGGDGVAKSAKTTTVTRRQFLKATAIAAGAAFFGKPVHAAEHPVNQETSSARKPESTDDKTPEIVRAYLRELISNPPDIGGKKNFREPLDEGLGWATYEFSEESEPFGENLINRTRDEILPRVQREKRLPTPWEQMMIESTSNNNVENSLQAAKYFTANYLTQTQEGLSPEEALGSNKVIGTIATREGQASLGKPYMVWSVSNPGGEPHFLGIVLNVDNSGNWNQHGNWQYNHQGWEKSGYNGRGLQWIIDASRNLKRLLIPVDKRNQLSDPALEVEITDRGQPGVIIVSTERYSQIISSSSRNTENRSYSP